VRPSEDNGAKNQCWSIEKYGKYFVIKASYNGLVLDVEQSSKGNGGRVIQWALQPSDNQLWEIVLVKLGDSELWGHRSGSNPRRAAVLHPEV